MAEIYCDARYLYLAFDGVVLRFPPTEAGLAKALRHIPNVTPLFLKPDTCVSAKSEKPKSRPKMPKVKLARSGVAISDEEATELNKLLEGLEEKK